jgi:glutathione peroxidase
MMAKCDVNGANSLPLFKLMRHAQPIPCDRGHEEDEENPVGVFKDPTKICWAPVTRTDILWNFEKFLVDKNGAVCKRFSPKFETIGLAAHIAELL